MFDVLSLLCGFVWGMILGYMIARKIWYGKFIGFKKMNIDFDDKSQRSLT